MRPHAQAVQRIAILSHGAAATRLIASARELPDTTAIALYEEGQEHSPSVRDADERACIGSRLGAPAFTQLGEQLGEVFRRMRVDAAWPGWGAAASDPVLAERCAQWGVRFVGPSAECLRGLQDRAALQRHARALGLTLAAGPEADESARELSVLLIADQHGAVWLLGPCIETSYCRQHPLLDEAPAAIEAGLAERLGAAAVQLARSLGLHNVATVRFRLRPQAHNPELVAVVPSLPPEHPLSEVTTGLDLVKLQLSVAAGERLGTAPACAAGYAAAARLHVQLPAASDPRGALCVERFSIPTGPFVRVDTGYAERDVLVADADPSFATIVASGTTRAEARQRLSRALVDTAVVLSHGFTDKSLVVDLLRGPQNADGSLDVACLSRATEPQAPRGRAAIALAYAAVEAYDAEIAVEKHEFARSAARGRPRVAAGAGCTVQLSHAGHGYTMQVERLDAERYHVEVDEHAIELGVLRVGPSESRVRVAGRNHRILAQTGQGRLDIEVDGSRYSVVQAGGLSVRAPAPAVIVSIDVAPGDSVAQGDCLVVLEAMKSYFHVHAPRAGRVSQVLVRPNTQVAAGRALLVLEAERLDSSPAGALRAPWGALATPVDDRAALTELRRLVLGYDVEPAAVRAAILHSSGDAGREDDVIEAFVDLLQLFRQHPAADAPVQQRDGRVSPTEYFFSYLRDLSGQGGGLPASFLDKLRAALRHYGVSGLERTPQLHESLFRICKAQQRLASQVAPMLALLQRRIDAAGQQAGQLGVRSRELLDRLIVQTHVRLPALNDAAREVRYLYFERALLDESRRLVFERAREHLYALNQALPASERRAHLTGLLQCPHPLLGFLSAQLPSAGAALRGAMLSVLLARHYQLPLDAVRVYEAQDLGQDAGPLLGSVSYESDGAKVRVVAAQVELAQLAQALVACARSLAEVAEPAMQLDIYCSCPASPASPASPLDALCDPTAPADVTARRLSELLQAQGFVRGVREAVVALASPGRTQYFSFRRQDAGHFVEQSHLRGVHPMLARRLELWRLARFDLQRLPSVEEVFLFRAVARDNPQDERLIALAEVRDLSPLRDEAGRLLGLPHVERVLLEALAAMRFEQTCRPPKQRPFWNRVQLFLREPLLFRPAELTDTLHRLAPTTTGLGLEHILVFGPMADAAGVVRERILDLFNVGSGPTMVMHEPTREPLEPLGPYAQKLARLHRQGLTHPYEIIALLSDRGAQSVSGFPPGEFIEHDLDGDAELAPITRAPGDNQANIVVGVLRAFTERYPEGMARVVLLSDPSREMGSLAEPECRRVIAALSLARRMRAPVEWFALSAGAKIAMDTGTETMDWIALVLRRIIEFTQDGGELNIVVHGINVGGQPYWNAEATMLMHTRGILIMTEDSSMVLTGKRALDFSGGISADDNFGIGGYERIMGPNGQAQYIAQDLTAACRILLEHYEHTYVAPGERMPRRAPTQDPRERSVLDAPHAAGYGFARVGDVFSADKNPERKRPFDIRSVLRAAVDQDHPPLERWLDQRGGEMAVVWDARLGGLSVCLLGIESQALSRMGMPAADGPDQYTPGTLFPVASKKIARAINAASGNRPLVVLANLTGFDGSPESMRHLQLEYGAEIGRAVVNFRGPIVFCVISRYHGGAFVVFSAKLHDNMEVAALEGSFASVIGGAPAAAVVFAREVERRTRRDPRLTAIEAEVASADARDRPALKARYDELFEAVHAQTLGEIAHEFDQVHTIERAQAVGSVHRIIPAAALRPYLIDALERRIAHATPHA